MFVFACLAEDTETHVVIGTAFINVSKLAMISFKTCVLHELFTNFYIMTKVALVIIWTTSIFLKFVTGFNLAFIMQVWAGLSAFTMNKLFADPIFCQLMRIW